MPTPKLFWTPFFRENGHSGTPKDPFFQKKGGRKVSGTPLRREKGYSRTLWDTPFSRNGSLPDSQAPPFFQKKGGQKVSGTPLRREKGYSQTLWDTPFLGKRVLQNSSGVGIGGQRQLSVNRGRTRMKCWESATCISCRLSDCRWTKNFRKDAGGSKARRVGVSPNSLLKPTSLHVRTCDRRFSTVARLKNDLTLNVISLLITT